MAAIVKFPSLLNSGRNYFTTVFIVVCLFVSQISASPEILEEEEKVAGESDETNPRQDPHHRTIPDSVVTMGQIDLDDLPIKGLTENQALEIMFERYRARMIHLQEPRFFDMDDLSGKEVGEICGNSASLECGKKVLKFLPSPSSASGDGNESRSGEDASQNQTSVYRRCNLRKEFLDCIDMQRKSCRRLADKGIYPRLPPKSIIRSTQSKIWRALWTSGGCVLIN